MTRIDRIRLGVIRLCRDDAVEPQVVLWHLLAEMHGAQSATAGLTRQQMEQGWWTAAQVGLRAAGAEFEAVRPCVRAP